MSFEKGDVSETNGNAIASSPDKAKYIFLVLAFTFFAAFAFQLWYFAVRTSAIVDEPAHILAGHRHWQCRDFGINPEHPPMLKMLATASLELKTLSEPPIECGSQMTSKADLFLYGTKFIVQNGIDDLVIPARLSAALVSLALAILVFAFVRRLFGRPEALTALALFVFEPNLLANGALVTTDMTIAATGFAATVAIYFYCRKPGVLRFCLAGLAVGLLLAAKQSAVIFMPILLAFVIFDALRYRRREMPFLKLVLRQISAFAGIFLIGLLILWAFYGFRYAAIPNETAGRISISEYIAATGRPDTVDSFSAKVVTALDRTHLFPESYMLGIADIVAYNSRHMYLFDRGYPTGRWFYFPISFLVKSSIALLVLLPFGLVFPFFNPDKRREMLFMLAPPIVFFAVALTSGTNIGVRHILPVYPFFIAAAAVGAVWMSRRIRLFRYFVIALLCYHAVTAFRIAPDYMAFANDFWGGNANTYKIFRDPNLDYGESIIFVKEYVEREGITNCWAALSGNIDQVVASQPCRALPTSFPLSNSDQLRDPIPPVIEGTVLLNATVMPPRSNGEYTSVLRSEPIARVGSSIFVYRGRFEVPVVAALSHVERAQQFVRLKRFEESLAESRRAVELAPTDARTHLALGIALLRTGQKEAARAEFEQTIEAAKSNPAVFRNAEVRAWQELKRLENN